MSFNKFLVGWFYSYGMNFCFVLFYLVPMQNFYGKTLNSPKA